MVIQPNQQKKSEILVGQGAGAMLGRSIWGQAKKEFGKIDDQKIKDEMVKEFLNYYRKYIL